MFAGRKLLIATKHKKEQVLAPLLESHLGVKCFTSDIFDTDTFGTFSGEIERIDDPISTVRNKCLWAMNLYNCDLAIASEGSFGPHPSLLFAPADDEVICFIDMKNKLDILVREISLETNFDGEQVKDLKQLEDFALRAKFPSHALILRQSPSNVNGMVKGITNWDDLNTTFNRILEGQSSAYVETDMRAMYNPTRMSVIATLGNKLVSRITSYCPVCSMPGFGITDKKPGLPCRVCGSPTRSVKSYLYQCQKCQFMKVEKYPDDIFTEDPAHCDICNP